MQINLAGSSSQFLSRLWVAMQELELASATIINRDEADTLVDAGKSIHLIPFCRWAIEQVKSS